MNTLFLVVKEKNTELAENTVKSIEINIRKNDLMVELELTKEELDHQLYFKAIDIIDKKKLAKIDFISVIQNGSFYQDNYFQLLEEYIDKQEELNKIIYLPFALLITEGATRGLLNTSLWNDNDGLKGELDYESALMQRDTILFGALISKDLFFDENNYNLDLKYYQHYCFLNRVTKMEDSLVIGIPKLAINIDFDLAYNHVSKEERIENYKLARNIDNEKTEELSVVVNE